MNDNERTSACVPGEADNHKNADALLTDLHDVEDFGLFEAEHPGADIGEEVEIAGAAGVVAVEAQELVHGEAMEPEAHLL